MLGPRANYRQPLLSNDEIFCGPDVEDVVVDGRVRCLRTPLGAFDLSSVLARLPPEQSPDYVLVKADATRRLLPRGLSRLKCPRILLVGDTHHLHQPLQTLLRYAADEPFDFILLDHTRHHAGWFHEAGFRNVSWLPALDYGFMPRRRVAVPSRPLTFVGQVGRHHPYRRLVLDRLVKAGLPLQVLAAPLTQTADIYADSAITLNISLNGDLNLRVFESLSAGGFLLTDELSASSGLGSLFESGKHLVTWRTADELVERIRWYHAHPKEADQIRTAGQAEIVSSHHPRVKTKEFNDLVFSGRENPRYVLPVKTQRPAWIPASRRSAVLDAYEVVQGLHAAAENVWVLTPDAAVDDLTACLDLPRIRVVANGDLPVSSAVGSAGGPPLKGEMILWWPAEVTGLEQAISQFAGTLVFAEDEAESVLKLWGFRRKGPMCFQLTERAGWIRRFASCRNDLPFGRDFETLLEQATTADEKLAVAELIQLRGGPHRLYAEALLQAVGIDRTLTSALLRLAEVRRQEGNTPQAAILLQEVSRLGGLSDDSRALLHRLTESCADDVEFGAYRSWLMGSARSRSEQPRRILIVTNLFPPEELGGYGRMIWEFAHGLGQRGHEVRVLCGCADYLRKDPTQEESEMELRVSRSLRLLGEWKGGGISLSGSPEERDADAARNAQAVVDAATDLVADLVLLGNLDLLGSELLRRALAAGFPVLHAVANAAPGYAPDAQPSSSLYSVGPCSNWNGRALLAAGYRPRSMETLYPGARLELFYRPILPEVSRLRIAYASLVMPYKGAHVLIEALAMMHQAGVDFSAEIAGDSTSPEFMAQLRDFCVRAGMETKVRFTGFLGRSGLAALFARSNVLVFPSQFEEPFGISQVEAMAAGLVVVSSGTGGAAEIVRHGIDGLLFPASDRKALAAHLMMLARKPQLMLNLQLASQRRARDFSVESAVLNIERRMAK